MINNKYKDDYTKDLRLNAGGRIVDDICYVGDYYILPFNENTKKKTNVINIVCALFLLGIQVIEGLLNADSSRIFWIVFPYMFVFLPIFYMFVGAVNYMGSPIKMQKAHYETGLVRIRRSCIGAMILEGINVILDIVYIILHFNDISNAREFIYLLSQVLFLLVAFTYGKYYDRTYGSLVIKKSENKLE